MFGVFWINYRHGEMHGIGSVVYWGEVDKFWDNNRYLVLDVFLVKRFSLLKIHMEHPNFANYLRFGSEKESK